MNPPGSWLPDAEPHRFAAPGDSFSLKDAAFVVCARVPLILTVTLLFVAGISFSVFWLISPTYQSKARIHVDLLAGSLPTLRAQGTFVSDAEKLAYFETVIQELKNPALIEGVVKELDLGETRVIGNVERIKNRALDLRRRVGLALGLVAWQAPRDPVAASAEAVASGLAVNRLENSTILELTYEAKSAAETERTLDAVIRRFIDSRHTFTREKAIGSTQFLAREIQRVRDDIAKVEESWVQLVKKDAFVMPANLMGKDPASGELVVTGLSTNDGVIEEMKIHLIRTQEELQVALTQYSESDPNVRRLRQLIRSYAEIINESPLLQTRSQRLKREVASKEVAYRELLAAYENALTMESRGLEQLSTIKVVQPPKKPGSSVKPKRTLALVVGTMLGLFLGVALAFGAAFLDDRIRRPIDVERRLGIRCVSSLPHV